MSLSQSAPIAQLVKRRLRSEQIGKRRLETAIKASWVDLSSIPTGGCDQKFESDIGDFDQSWSWRG